MNHYRINGQNQWRHWKRVPGAFILGTSLLLMYTQLKSIEFNIFYFQFALGCALLMFIGPLAILHFEYYIANKHMSMNISIANRFVVINQQSERSEFSFEDIKVVHLFKTINNVKQRSGLLWEVFHYSEIELKNGQKFIITSLMAPDIAWPLDDSKVMIHEMRWPGINWKWYW